MKAGRATHSKKSVNFEAPRSGERGDPGLKINNNRIGKRTTDIIYGIKENKR